MQICYVSINVKVYFIWRIQLIDNNTNMYADQHCYITYHLLSIDSGYIYIAMAIAYI